VEDALVELESWGLYWQMPRDSNEQHARERLH